LNAAKAIMNLPSWLQAVMADPAGKAIVAIVAVYAIAMTAALGSRWFPKASPWVWRVVVSALVFLAGLLFFQTFDVSWCPGPLVLPCSSIRQMLRIPSLH
jgi:hypothetical protein